MQKKNSKTKTKNNSLVKVVSEKLTDINIEINTKDSKSPGVEFHIKPQDKIITVELCRFSDSLRRMNVGQCKALGESFILAAKVAEKYIK